ncbi:MAG: hypothetical protein OEW33_12345 [Nitrospirota bacterium]|nr:hypothetical protein [Nitrospirota bacterium]
MEELKASDAPSEKGEKSNREPGTFDFLDQLISQQGKGEAAAKLLPTLVF